MFRIRLLHSNPSARILKVEGEVREHDLSALTEALKDFDGWFDREVILDLSSVSYFSPEAVTVLETAIEKGFYLLNCSPLVKNILQTAGFGMNRLQ